MRAINFNGVIDNSVHFIEKNQLLRTDLWKRFVQQFKDAADYDTGWRGEYWGKMMRGACFVYQYSKNEELYEILTDTVKDMLTTQDDLGRISTYPVEQEFDGWDIWCRKYVLLGMQYFLEICKDEELAARILDSMCRQMDYLIEHIGTREEGKKPITKTTNQWRGLNSSSILEPVVRLYQLTNKQEYLDFATYIVSCGGTDIVNIFELAYENKLYPYQYPNTKAYEMTSCFDGLLEYYYVTGNERYRTAIINFANRILESDFTIIGSCGCTHELFDHSTVRQANTTNGIVMQETCVTVTLMKFFYRLSVLTGESKFADAFEISLYNAYLGAINTEHALERTLREKCPGCEYEPLPFDSYSPLTAGMRGYKLAGRRIMSDGHYYGCCACIGSMGLGLVPKMAFYPTDKGYAVNLYIDGRMETVTEKGNRLCVYTETIYPVGGRIRMTIELDKSENFELAVRIPAWSRQTKLRLNGVPIAVSEGYVTLDREWTTGDVIELELDMRTRAIRPISYGSQVLMNTMLPDIDYLVATYDEEDPLAKNHLAIQRGPIILAQDNRLGYSVDVPVDIIVSEDGYVDSKIPEQKKAPYERILELEIPLADGSKMLVTDYASAGKLWTKESKMAAWMLTK